jgi:hypothetical protein
MLSAFCTNPSNSAAYCVQVRQISVICYASSKAWEGGIVFSVSIMRSILFWIRKA